MQFSPRNDPALWSLCLDPLLCVVDRSRQEEREGKPERFIMDFGGKIFPTYFLRNNIREHKPGLGRSPTGWGSGPTGLYAVEVGGISGRNGGW